MKMLTHFILSICILVCGIPVQAAALNQADTNDGIRLKELLRLSSAHENSLVGTGLVMGLAGSGDSSRNAITEQALRNTLGRLGLNLGSEKLRTRNTATVLVSATIPPFAQPGHKIDINITSMADARSLVGGTLLRTELLGPDNKVYALAQGPLTIGGYSYDLNGNLIQKNHPTSGTITNGAVIERKIDDSFINDDNEIEYVLNQSDFTTSERILDAINSRFGYEIAYASGPARINISIPDGYKRKIVKFVTKIENLTIVPDSTPKIVVNERTGTVVAGGDVKLSPITISHGDLKVVIKTDLLVSQPSFVRQTRGGVRTAIVPDTSVEVDEKKNLNLSLRGTSSVSDLIKALHEVKATSRDIITILQAMKRTGALHAELIVQ